MLKDRSSAHCTRVALHQFIASAPLIDRLRTNACSIAQDRRKSSSRLGSGQQKSEADQALSLTPMIPLC